MRSISVGWPLCIATKAWFEYKTLDFGLEKRTNSSPVSTAVRAMPLKISNAETIWPYVVSGDIVPWPTVASVSRLKKKASPNEPGRAFAMLPGCAR